MRKRINIVWNSLSLAQQFMLASVTVLVTTMVGVGWWIGQEITHGVVHRAAATTALHVGSFVSPQLQVLAERDSLPPESVAALDRLLHDTPLGREIVAFHVWNGEGRVLYSSLPGQAGRVYPMSEGLVRAWQGEVVAEIDEPGAEENTPDLGRRGGLLETYRPVRLLSSERVIAVIEFYESIEDLKDEIAAARLRSWLVVGSTTLLIYLALVEMVRRCSATIARQRAELTDTIARLRELLAQNEELNERVRRAANRTASLNERYLRRVSVELHDGPAQDLGVALLRLDQAITASGPRGRGGANGRRRQVADDLELVQRSLRHAMTEVRTISSGLRLPELESLSVAELLARVVYVHERRTETSVTLDQGDLPERAPGSVKITLYRLIQEALANAHRHAGGVGQRVRVSNGTGHLEVEVSDRGPGFDPARVDRRDGHIGLAGMRERVESLGGVFRLESELGCGTRVIARLPLAPVEAEDGG